jgi:Tol biopolymer transport system component
LHRHTAFVGGLLLGAAAATSAVAGVIERVSVDSAGAESNGSSRGPALSAEGRFVAFESDASNLVPGATNFCADGYCPNIFVHDRQTGSTERVSVDSSGTQGNGASHWAAISADGRFVAFWSEATNLVPDDTNHCAPYGEPGYNCIDIFVHDRQTGDTERASVNSEGAQVTGDSLYPAISGDGRFVAFQSTAPDLVEDDNNFSTDIFVHDRQTGATERVSIDSLGGEANGGSFRPSISADGRFVAFESFASNLVPDDTNFCVAWVSSCLDVFVHDRQTGATERVSVSSGGEQSPLDSVEPAISADGRFVTFLSAADNLVPGDTAVCDFPFELCQDVFVRDRQLSTTERASVNLDGGPAQFSYGATVSADGRYVAFQSGATDIVPDDTNPCYSDPENFFYCTDVFVRDRQTGRMERASVSAQGAEADSSTIDAPVISADGRFVAFQSYATNLVPGDTNAKGDVFVAAVGSPPTTSTTTVVPTATTIVTTTTLACSSAHCILLAAELSSPCAASTVPPGVVRRFDRAAALMDEAGGGPSRRTTRLRRRAKRLLSRAKEVATRAVRRKPRKLSAPCAAALRTAADTVATGR